MESAAYLFVSILKQSNCVEFPALSLGSWGEVKRRGMDCSPSWLGAKEY
jgi:hypothetical protein